jgi:hypothetical protein
LVSRKLKEKSLGFGNVGVFDFMEREIGTDQVRICGWRNNSL